MSTMHARSDTDELPKNDGFFAAGVILGSRTSDRIVTTNSLETQPRPWRNCVGAVSDFEVEHRALSIVSNRAQTFACGYFVANMYVDGRKVTRDRIVVIAVIDDHEAPIGAVAI